MQFWEKNKHVFESTQKSESHTCAIYSVEFSQDGTYMVSTSSDCIKIWKRNNNQFKLLQIMEQRDYVNIRNTVKFSPDGMYLVSVPAALDSSTFTDNHWRKIYPGKDIKTWKRNDLLNGKTIKVWKRTSDCFVLDKELEIPDAKIVLLAFSPDGKYLVSVSYEYGKKSGNSIKIWEKRNDTFELYQSINIRDDDDVFRIFFNGKYISWPGKECIKLWKNQAIELQEVSHDQLLELQKHELARKDERLKKIHDDHRCVIL